MRMRYFIYYPPLQTCLMNVKVMWVLNTNDCVSLGIKLSLQLESQVSLMAQVGLQSCPVTCKPLNIVLGKQIQQLWGVCRFAITVRFNFCNHLCTKSILSRESWYWGGLLFLWENWDSIWDFINVTSSLCPWRLLQYSTLLNYQTLGNECQCQRPVSSL